MSEKITPGPESSHGYKSSRYQCSNCQREDGFEYEYHGQGQRNSNQRNTCKYCGYIRKGARA